MTRIAIILAATVLYAAPAYASDQTGRSGISSTEQTAAAKPKPKKEKKDKQEYLVVTMENLMVSSY